MTTIQSREQAGIDAFADAYHKAITTDGEEMSDGEVLDEVMEAFNKHLLCFMTDTTKADELCKGFT